VKCIATNNTIQGINGYGSMKPQLEELCWTKYTFSINEFGRWPYSGRDHYRLRQRFREADIGLARKSRSLKDEAETGILIAYSSDWY
jgi:hypothetical protein